MESLRPAVTVRKKRNTPVKPESPDDPHAYWDDIKSPPRRGFGGGFGGDTCWAEETTAVTQPATTLRQSPLRACPMTRIKFLLGLLRKALSLVIDGILFIVSMWFLIALIGFALLVVIAFLFGVLSLF